MSNIQVQKPLIHTPSFTEYKIAKQYLRFKLQELGLETIPADFSFDSWYYYTDLNGWGKLLPDLIIHSDLYKEDKFDCEDYALKAQVICAERYGLNAFRLCLGNSPQGFHGFNIFYFGEGFMLWEPNGGFELSGSAFEVGEEGYLPKYVLL